MNGKETGQKKDKIFTVVGSAVLCAFASLTVCFFMPMDIFLNNAADMAFPIRSLVKYPAMISAAVFAVLFAGCLLIRGRANGIYRAAVFGLALAFYIQGNLLAVNMGELNGVRYSATAGEILLNVLIWLGLLAVPFFLYFRYRESFRETLLFVSGALIVLQTVTLFITYNKKQDDWGDFNISKILYGTTRPICTNKNFNLYSEEDNLIILLVDAYDSFYFDTAAKAAPETLSEFDGFTYYTNTVGKWGMTIPAVSNILTGANVDGEVGDYENQTLFELLNEHYITNIYGNCTVPPAYILEKYTDNYLDKQVTFSDTLEYSSAVFKITFFRCMPEAVKPLFWVGNADLGSFSSSEDRTEYSMDNLEFLSSAEDEFESTAESVFKYIHLTGLHYPLNINQDLEYDPTQEFPPEDAAIGMNKILNRYLAALKENGVYDSSEIIIMADHGLYGHYDQKYPLLMYKPAYQSGTGITVSNAPISYDDIYPTLIRLAGGEPDARTIFDIGEDEERVRHYCPTDEDIFGNIKENPQ